MLKRCFVSNHPCFFVVLMLVWCVCRKPIITLPLVEYSVVDVDLSIPEREFYNALLDKSQSVFDGFIQAGTASKSWFAIFSLLQRLRQACDHVALTVHSRYPPKNKQHKPIDHLTKNNDETTNNQNIPPINDMVRTTTHLQHSNYHPNSFIHPFSSYIK